MLNKEYRMLINCVLVILCTWWGGVVADQTAVTIQDNGFDGVLIAINPTIAEDPRIITNIRNMFTRASLTLFTATKKRAYFRNINILVPKTWTSGSYNEAIGLSYSKADVIIAQANPQKGNIPYSEHTGGCGEHGRFIHLTPEYVVDNMEEIFGAVEKVLVHEWAHIRWGVFDEYATRGHGSHYVDSDGVLQGTRCPKSLRGLNIEFTPPYTNLCEVNRTTGLPQTDTCAFYVHDVQHPELNTSMMSHSYVQQVIEFCHSDPSDPVNQHNTEADNEQNAKCNLRSTWDVITSTSDFSGGSNPPNPTLTNLAPTFRVVRQVAHRRFVLVLDVSGSMRGDRMLMMRQSASTFITTSLPIGDCVGITSFQSTSQLLLQISNITSSEDRANLTRMIPISAGGTTCIGCGIKTAIDEMERDNPGGVCGDIIVLTDGMENEEPKVETIAPMVREKNCTVHAIFFTTAHNRELAELAIETGGQWYFAQDRDIKRLMGAFTAIATEDDGDLSNRISTLLYKQYVVTPGTSTMDGVNIDITVGSNTKFLFTWQSNKPDITLTHPSGCVYSTSSNLIPNACEGHPLSQTDRTLKIIQFIIPGVATRGRWIFTITTRRRETISATVTSKSPPNVLPIVIKSGIRGNTSQINKPVVIEARITRGDPGSPMVGLRVFAIVEKPDLAEETLQLLDNGAGPDSRRNDGVYSRMFYGYTARGRYSIQIRVEGDGSAGTGSAAGANAPLMFGRILQNGTIVPNLHTAGMLQWRQNKQVGPFSRIHTSPGLEYTGPVHDPNVDTIPPNQITDFSARQNNINNPRSGIRVRFTSPGDDEDSGTADTYNICYSFESIGNLTSNFEESICVSNFSRPKVAGSSEDFVIPAPDLRGRKGTVRIAIGIKSTDEALQVSRLSNVMYLNYFVRPPRRGLRCLVCYKARSHEECEATGTIKRCLRNEQQCATDIRTLNWGRKEITKYCKQEAACLNERKQNPVDCRNNGPNKLCRCCCGSDLCNVDATLCTGSI